MYGVNSDNEMRYLALHINTARENYIFDLRVYNEGLCV